MPWFLADIGHEATKGQACAWWAESLAFWPASPHFLLCTQRLSHGQPCPRPVPPE